MFTVITPPPSSGCRVALAALNCDFTMSSRRQPRSLAQLHLMEGVSEKQPRGLTVSSSPSGGTGSQHRRFRPALRLRTVAKGTRERREPRGDREPGKQHRRFRPALRLRTVAKGNQPEPEVGNNDNKQRKQKA